MTQTARSAIMIAYFLRRRSYSSSLLSGALVMSTGSAVWERRISPSWHSVAAECSCRRGAGSSAMRHDGPMPRSRPPDCCRRTISRALRSALADYTVDAVHELLGLDRSGRRTTAVTWPAWPGRRAATPPAATRDRGLATLVRLFLLGHEVGRGAPPGGAGARCRSTPPRGRARRGHRRARCAPRVDLRPIGAEGGPPAGGWSPTSASDVRPGPLRRDHVLGIGVGVADAGPGDAARRRSAGRWTSAPAAACRRCTWRRHADSVVGHRRQRPGAAPRGDHGRAERAGLGPAARVAARPGRRRAVRPRRGQPAVRRVRRVARGGYDYRDSGLAGDARRRAAGRRHPAGLLAPGGTAVLLANWIVTAERAVGRAGDGLARPAAGATPGSGSARSPTPASTSRSGCATPGERPGTARWTSATTPGSTGSPRPGSLARRHGAGDAVPAARDATPGRRRWSAEDVPQARRAAGRRRAAGLGRPAALAGADRRRRPCCEPAARGARPRADPRRPAGRRRRGWQTGGAPAAADHRPVLGARGRRGHRRPGGGLRRHPAARGCRWPCWPPASEPASDEVAAAALPVRARPGRRAAS